MHIAAMSEAVIKALRSDDAVTRLAQIFHALSDETRLRIVGCLLTGEMCVCDLTGALGATQSRLSFHMKTLKDAGLVTDRREGRWIHYSMVPEAVQEMQRLLGQIADRAVRCCQ